METTQTSADYAAQTYAFYIHGERHIETIVKKDGLVAYQDEPTTPEQYLQANPKATIMPLDDAVEQIQRLNHAAYCKPWKEVSENLGGICLKSCRLKIMRTVETGKCSECRNIPLETLPRIMRELANGIFMPKEKPPPAIRNY
tara:strand:+ start:49 stop:477 length:429 start_codon:yes stop_codon:yes gene_type:complete